MPTDFTNMCVYTSLSTSNCITLHLNLFLNSFCPLHFFHILYVQKWAPVKDMYCVCTQGRYGNGDRVCLIGLVSRWIGVNIDFNLALVVHISLWSLLKVWKEWFVEISNSPFNMIIFYAGKHLLQDLDACSLVFRGSPFHGSLGSDHTFVQSVSLQCWPPP